MVYYVCNDRAPVCPKCLSLRTEAIPQEVILHRPVIWSVEWSHNHLFKAVVAGPTYYALGPLCRCERCIGVIHERDMTEQACGSLYYAFNDLRLREVLGRL